MHTEVHRQEITYYISDDGKEKSRYKEEIEHYEAALEAQRTLKDNDFIMVMEFDYHYPDEEPEDHSIYRVNSEEQFQALLTSYGRLYNRKVFRPELYANMYKNRPTAGNKCLFDFIYETNCGDGYDTLTVEYLGYVINGIQVDCDECYQKYTKKKKILDDLKSLK